MFILLVILRIRKGFGIIFWKLNRKNGDGRWIIYGDFNATKNHLERKGRSEGDRSEGRWLLINSLMIETLWTFLVKERDLVSMIGTER